MIILFKREKSNFFSLWKDIIILIDKERKIRSFSFFRFEWSVFVKTWIPYTLGCFAPIKADIVPVVQVKKIF